MRLRSRTVLLLVLMIGMCHAVLLGRPTVIESAPLDLPATFDAAVAPDSVAVGVLKPATEPAAPRPVSTMVPTGWHGRIGSPAYVRRGPLRGATIVRELQRGEPVHVLHWVAGDPIETDNPTWAEIAPGEFVYGMLLQPDPLPESRPRSDAPTTGKWIDVDTTHQIATAYEGALPIHSTFVSTGRPGWETPNGVWPIQRRVERETMDGATLKGQGPSGVGASYRLEHVRWTQYFTADGSAIHENYWRDPSTFGVPGSHGCLGMAPDEAYWFWRWAEVGTPLVVHAD